MRARDRLMMEVALQHAQGAIGTLPCTQGLGRCHAYEGSVWNGGTHVTIIVDRGLCKEHGSPFSAVESWIYDIRGASIEYVGKDCDPRTAGVLKTPDDN